MPTLGRRPSNIGYRQSRRLELLLKAGQVFSEVGYDCASMEILAQRLDVTKATLYSYFRSKAELFKAVIAHWASELPVFAPPAQRATTSLRNHLSDLAQAVLRQETLPAAIAIAKTQARSIQLPSSEDSNRWSERRNHYQMYVEPVLASRKECSYPSLAAQQFLLLIHSSIDPFAADASNSGATQAHVAAAVDIFARAFPDKPG